jgi:hypothetical protein
MRDGGKSIVIVPATVPGPTVQRLAHTEPEGRAVASAEPAVVPAAHAVPVIPEQLTVAQVEELRAENELLRQEIARVRGD